MTALPASALDDDAPMRGALYELPTGDGATIVPLIPGVEEPAHPLDRPASDTPEPTVARRALFDRLAEAGAVTIVSGPAASGKTCLLRSWIAAAGLSEQAGWATVRPDERDPERFWRSVTDAVAPIEGGPGVLVIDDLHELKSTEAQTQLEQFVTSLPAQLRVVLLTRAPMGLRLLGLRLSGGLTELRAVDLRFSIEETRELFDAAAVALSDAGVAVLRERSEGWVGGLRLAAAQLATHSDPERFAREFSGGERTVAAYLLAEVVNRQRPEVRELLLRTSMLERVSGPLADALVGVSGSVRVLQELDDAGAFVTGIDVGRSWFRFHPLLADVLRMELRRVDPALVATLHRAAGQWHERHGDTVAAIYHAQAAGDWPHAASLLGDHLLELVLDGRMAAVRELLGAFPRHAPASDAELALASAMASAFDGLDDESAAHLAVAQHLAATLPDGRRGRFELGLAGTSLWLARLRGDVGEASEAFDAVEAALCALPASERARTCLHRATALLNLGIAEVSSSRPDGGCRRLEQALGLARRLRRPYLEMSCLGYLALGAARSGLAVSVARRTAEQAVAIAAEHGWDTDHDPAAAFAVAAMALMWLGRFADGARRLDRAEKALAGAHAPAVEVLLDGARALGCLGEGRFDDAMAAFQASEDPLRALPGEHPLSLDLRARALRLRLRLGLGGTAAVRAALAEWPSGSCRRAELRLTDAALELAEDRPERALDALRPVIERSSPSVYPALSAIEALLLAAAAHAELGDVRAVGESLERALALAEPDGLVLPFVLVPVRELLERHQDHRTSHATLLATIVDMLAGGALQPDAEPLREPLSNAELRVVRHLPSNLKATEIASQLCVSTNTVRTHLRHIYSKLDAHSRSEAVTRARTLGLLAARLA
jgi:LuxR family transcriptional regulator, maltose regulon positive regulatory protein